MTSTLSEHWRVNKSVIKEYEAVEILRSLGRLVEMVKGNDDKKASEEKGEAVNVRFKTKRPAGKNTVEINAALLERAPSYPLSAQSFDVLCGETLHGLAHLTVGSQHAIDFSGDSIYRAVATAGEELTVDKFYQGKKAQYIDRMNEHYRRLAPSLTGEPVRDALVGFLSLLQYKEPLPLEGLSAQIFEIMQQELPGVDRLDVFGRIGRYDQARARIAEALQEYERRKEDISAPTDSSPSPVGKEGSAEGKEEFHGWATAWPLFPNAFEDELDEEMGQHLEELLMEETADVSAAVARFMDTNQNVPVITKVSTSGNYLKVDEALRRDLLWLANMKTLKDTVTIRELESGKIDARRLWRAPLESEIFRERRLLHRQKRKIWLLLDSSGSMRSDEGMRLYSLCATAYNVLGQETRVYSYRTKGGEVIITRLEDKAGVRNPDTENETPSGTALAYVGSLLERDGGGLLVHFTDGGCNRGHSLPYSLKNVSAKCPRVQVINVTMGVQYHTAYPRVTNIDIENVEQFGQILTSVIASAWDCAY
ncbi:MAG: VWA domain-containing protein [Chloroflexi bacterium]|nr:VWA domain-containing protein [Chloroflexota bacterium]